MLRIPTEYIKAMLKVVPKDDVRYYLNGMYVEYVGNNFWHFVATDGYIMLAGRMYDSIVQDNEKIIIPYDVLKANTKGEYVILRRSESGEYFLGDVLFKPIDGRYPDYRKAMPSFKNVNNKAVYNPTKLHDLKTAINTWRGYKGLEMMNSVPTVSVGDGGIGMVHYKEDDVVGVIMPIKNGGDDPVPAYWSN